MPALRRASLEGPKGLTCGAHVSSTRFQIDFAAWSDLAQRDPQAFFVARQALIDDFIRSAPPRHRDALREFQNLIDHTRVTAGTPINATRELMLMMGDHLESLYVQLELLCEETRRFSACLPRLSD